MIKNWITFGMSAYHTPGFQDTSRLMTAAWQGPKVYIEPPKPFRSWKKFDGTILRWESNHIQETTILKPPLPIPSRIDPLNWSVSMRAKALNFEIASYLGIDWRESTLLYLTNWTPYLQPLVSKINPKYLVLDFVDDVLNFPYNWNVDRVNLEYRKLIQIASKVICVSPALQKLIRTKFGIESTVLPNGVSEKFFLETNTTPKLLNQIDGKLRIGFAGTLNHWIDFESMEYLASQFPENAFILMGKRGHLANRDQEKALEKLLHRKNVHELGPIDYLELPAYLHNMDILMLTRIPSKSSEASSPLKLYEYLAVGKPIVTSGFPVPANIHPFIYNSKSQKGLERSMQLAISELQSKQRFVRKQRRQLLARQNTWHKRIQTIKSIIEKVDEEQSQNMLP